MAASTTIRRRGAKAAAAERAAKERRQLYIVIGLGVVLLIVLAVMVLPRLTGGGSSTSATSTTASSVATTPAAVAPLTGAVAASATSAQQKRELRRALREAKRDPFVGSVTPGPSTLGSIANPPGLHDPFASPSAPESNTAPAAPTVPGPPIKGTIIIGTPGSGSVAEHGWIVILASIPTAKGKSAATSFVSAARRAGVSSLSILNSSNRRPLRGGYWVVYTGPFTTLGEGNRNATSVHGHGFTSAYIRQLIVYRKKS